MGIIKRYATEDYVESQVDTVDIPTKVSSLENDAGYLTEHQDLSNYYTKIEVNDLHSDLHDYVDQEVAALVNSAPETLDTLGELATALQENQEVVEVLNDAIATKYGATNPPPYPVTSVEGKTGAVTLNSETWTFTLSDGTTVTKNVVVK